MDNDINVEEKLDHLLVHEIYSNVKDQLKFKIWLRKFSFGIRFVKSISCNVKKSK